ncbi:MAG TPA: SRPBCC family protein, partial [Actinomycetota bacterium]|nr:SRPBCC family protein [Actinomycetota bacterium]
MTSDQQQARTATLTTPGDREIRVERIFDAPRERVFAVYLDPELIPEWWGPHGTTTVVDEMDVRNGGYWRFLVRNEDGTESAFRGAFREIVPNERIVQTFEWEPMAGHVSVDAATFEDLGDGRTKVTTVSTFHTTEERDGMLDSGMEWGMNQTFERLDAVLARLA